MTIKEKKEVLRLFTIGYKAFEIAEKMDYAETYICNVIRALMLERGTTPQEFLNQKRLSEIKVNEECYNLGKHDGLNQVINILNEHIDKQLANGITNLLYKYFK